MKLRISLRHVVKNKFQLCISNSLIFCKVVHSFWWVYIQHKFRQFWQRWVCVDTPAWFTYPTNANLRVEKSRDVMTGAISNPGARKEKFQTLELWNLQHVAVTSYTLKMNGVETIFTPNFQVNVTNIYLKRQVTHWIKHTEIRMRHFRLHCQMRKSETVL